MAEETGTDLVELATELTIAWLSNPNTRVAADEAPAFLRKMHETVSELVNGISSESSEGRTEDASDQFVPAVTPRKSLASKDHIISLIDGKPYKTLRRHLTSHGLTPEEYRRRYKLKPDYPMVAENYSAARRAMAKKIGLGSKGRAAGGGGSAPARKPRAKASPA